MRFCYQDPSNPLLPNGFSKLTQILIDANADVNICNKIGQTALHRASQVRHAPSFDELRVEFANTHASAHDLGYQRQQKNCRWRPPRTPMVSACLSACARCCGFLKIGSFVKRGYWLFIQSCGIFLKIRGACGRDSNSSDAGS